MWVFPWENENRGHYLFFGPDPGKLLNPVFQNWPRSREFCICKLEAKILLVDNSDIFYFFCSFGEGEGGVRGAKGGVAFSLENPI